MTSLAARIFVAISLMNALVFFAVDRIFVESFETRRLENDRLIASSLAAHGGALSDALARGEVDTELARLESEIGLEGAVISGERAFGIDDTTRDEMRDAVLGRGAAGDEARIATGSPWSHRRWREWVVLPLADGTIVAATTPTRRTWGGFFSPVRVHLTLLSLVAALVSWALARWLGHPIAALREATQKLASGDLSVRVTPQVSSRAAREVRALATDFDTMTTRIDQLLAARERLLRDVSHELRSPLARLSVALEVARQADDPRPDTRAALDRIEREAERLEELIALVLTMAKLDDASGFDLEERVRIDHIVLDVAADATYEGKKQDCEVVVVSAPELETRGNAELLRQALENVVRNAMRFAPRGTGVEVRVAREESRGNEVATIEVRDHGPGVPDEALEDIFRPFTRVASARERASGGAGIGLAITARAMRLHRGAARAKNVEGGGLVVTLSLPLAS